MQQLSRNTDGASINSADGLRRLSGEEGATLAEYALLVVLIAIPVSFAMPALAGAIRDIFNLLAAAF